MSKVTQLHCSSSVIFFKEKIIKQLKLQSYSDKNKPVLFFGYYQSSSRDVPIYNSHKGKAIIMLAGSDISPYAPSYKKNYVENIKFFKNMDKNKYKIITISNFQSNILKKHNIPHENINIGWTMNLNVHPIPKGKSIYIYTSKGNHLYYGSLIYEEVIRRLQHKYNFIVAGSTKIVSNSKKTLTEQLIQNYSNPFDAYKQCFIGLRLVPFDGNANTVKELGLCGIKVIHNGNDKNCIPWNYYHILFDNKIPLTNPDKAKAFKYAVDDIIIKIENESKTIGQIDKKLSEEVKNNISFDDNFLYF